MGPAHSLIAMAVLGITACVPDPPKLTEVQLTARRAAEQREVISDMRRNATTLTTFEGNLLKMVLVKVPRSPHCVSDTYDSAGDDDSNTERCEEEFTGLLRDRIMALLKDRAVHGTCTLRNVELLHARVVWRGPTNGGPATLPSGALVFMECCGEPTSHPCSEVHGQ